MKHLLKFVKNVRRKITDSYSLGRLTKWITEDAEEDLINLLW